MTANTLIKNGRRLLPDEDYDIEHRIVVDNQIKWVREKAYLEFDDKGELSGGFGITQDITKQKDAEAVILREKNFTDDDRRLASRHFLSFQ